MLKELQHMRLVRTEIAEVEVAVNLLAFKARKSPGSMVAKLDGFAQFFQRCHAIARTVHPGSTLYEHLKSIMQQAAAEPATYKDAQACLSLASAQRQWRLPCKAFWRTLSVRGVPSVENLRQEKLSVMCALLANRAILGYTSMLGIADNTLWRKLLSATCRALDAHPRAERSAVKSVVWAMSEIAMAKDMGFPAATQRSPCWELQKETVLKLVTALEKANLDSRLVTRVCEAVSLHSLWEELSPKLVDKLVSATIRFLPKMKFSQVARAACLFASIGIPIPREGVSTLKAAIVRTLHLMDIKDLASVVNYLSSAKVQLGSQTLAALQKNLVLAAAAVESVCQLNVAAGAFGRLLIHSGMSADHKSKNAFLARYEHAIPRMDHVELSNAMLAFSKIPLPLNSLAGQVLLARLPEMLDSMDARSVRKTLTGLRSARETFPEVLFGAVWKALIRTVPEMNGRELVGVLESSAFLDKQIVLPEEVRVALRQAASRCAPQLDSKAAEEMTRWLRILDLDVPNEFLALG
jgi:hypothetical protein